MGHQVEVRACPKLTGVLFKVINDKLEDRQIIR
jgi:hypothetical protein